MRVGGDSNRTLHTPNFSSSRQLDCTRKKNAVMTLLGAALFGGGTWFICETRIGHLKATRRTGVFRLFCVRVFVSHSSRLLNKCTRHNHKIYFDRHDITLQSISSFGCITDRHHRRTNLKYQSSFLNYDDNSFD